MTNKKGTASGRLRIGDDWNAIRIIALSQSNPLKAIAELVENSIDARARTVTITRGRDHGELYLAIRDDGDGVPRREDGVPDFRYVATHICDSIKRRLKTDGATQGLQGEFGIGLLSFWTVGENLTVTSTGADQRSYQMKMRKGDPGYEVGTRRVLFAERGTEIRIAPLLEGIRALSGEKIQWYLASELRDRIRQSGVRITVIDRLARKQFEVEPRQFEGRLLHQLPAVATPFGEVYCEIYLSEPQPASRIGLSRSGTRVIEDLGTLPGLENGPWSTHYLQGLIDAPFLNVSPATRSGIIHDERFAALVTALRPLADALTALIDEQRRAEEEQASQQLLRTIQRAFREALLALPLEEYDWFDVQARKRLPGGAQQQGHTNGGGAAVDETGSAVDELLGVSEPLSPGTAQREFFQYAGPLFSVVISPSAATIGVGESRVLRSLPRDRSRRRVEEDLSFEWELVEGGGSLNAAHDQQVTFTAARVPGLTRIRVTVRQREIACSAEALITITESLLPVSVSGLVNTRGLPSYTLERAAGELWRSRFDQVRNVIVINNGHRDFVFASRTQALKLRYLIRLYVKELVLRNFAGLPPDQLLERMIELSLYTEEKLKSAT